MYCERVVMWIDVKIPYEPRKRLADAYNRSMENTTAEWVLLLDQDVFVSCNPLWYLICLDAVKALANTKAGLVLCMTSGSRQKSLQRVSLTDTDQIEDHIDIARKVYKEHGNKIERFPSTIITGFFMLVRRTAWQQIKFNQVVKGRVGGIDVDFSSRLVEAGYNIYILPGLYVYHRRGIRKLDFP